MVCVDRKKLQKLAKFTLHANRLSTGTSRLTRDDEVTDAEAAAAAAAAAEGLFVNSVISLFSQSLLSTLHLTDPNYISETSCCLPVVWRLVYGSSLRLQLEFNASIDETMEVLNVLHNGGSASLTGSVI